MISHKNIGSDLITIITFISLGLLTGCTKQFEKYNTNPNNITDEMLDQDNLRVGAFFKAMEQNIFPYGGTGSTSTNAYQTSENLCGDIYGGFHGMTHNWNASGDGTSYNFSLGWNSTAFNMFFTGVMGNWNFIKGVTETVHPDLYAVAQIIKVYAAHRTVDMYGPIPYSKAGVGLGAAYDGVEAIYSSFFTELDAAIQVLKPYATSGGTPLRLFDEIYGGKYTQWIRFANSLKLRLAMRIVYADAAKAKLNAESAVNDNFGVIVSNDDNAFVRGINGKTYSNPLGGLTNDYSETRMSANMESFLNGYTDPRKTKYFQPSAVTGDPANTFRGIRSGITISNQTPYNAFSKLQTNFDIIWFVASETWFLRAEGALRGWDMGGTSQALYESGVKTSFEQWGAGDASAVATYLANNTAKPAEYKDPVSSSNNVSAGTSLSTATIKWDAAATFEVNLERIITQKWIAIYPNGQEAWSEFRRTRYPKVFPVVNNKSGGSVVTATQIRRLPYPTEEYSRNGPNLAQGVVLLGGPDNGGTRIWWDKKP